MRKRQRHAAPCTVQPARQQSRAAQQSTASACRSSARACARGLSCNGSNRMLLCLACSCSAAEHGGCLQEFSSDMRSRPVKRLEDTSRLRRAQFPEDAGAMRRALHPSAARCTAGWAGEDQCGGAVAQIAAACSPVHLGLRGWHSCHDWADPGWRCVCRHPIRPDSYVKMDNFYTGARPLWWLGWHQHACQRLQVQAQASCTPLAACTTPVLSGVASSASGQRWAHRGPGPGPEGGCVCTCSHGVREGGGDHPHVPDPPGARRLQVLGLVVLSDWTGLSKAGQGSGSSRAQSRACMALTLTQCGCTALPAAGKTQALSGRGQPPCCPRCAGRAWTCTSSGTMAARSPATTSGARASVWLMCSCSSTAACVLATCGARLPL